MNKEIILENLTLDELQKEYQKLLQQYEVVKNAMKSYAAKYNDWEYENIAIKEIFRIGDGKIKDSQQ